MTAEERVRICCTSPKTRLTHIQLTLLRALVLWALNTSEAIQNLIKAAYKQTRRDDDKNQPKSVQPWFSDSYRRKYYLIEGLEDTHFRVYRENDGKTAKTNTWFSIAGSIEEVTALADKLEVEGTTLGKVNAGRIRSAIPRFEAGEEVCCALKSLHRYTNSCIRSVNVGIIVSPAKPLFSVLIQVSHFTKVEQEASVCATHTPMEKRRIPMLCLAQDQLETQVMLHQLNRGRPSLPVVVK